MATVPMFDPQGTVRLVPQDQAQNALSSGGKPAVKMLDPQGTARWVPQDQQQNAPEGWKLADSTATPDAQPTQPDTSIGGRIKSSLQGIWEGNADPVTNLSIGAVKQGMGLIGGIMKIAHDKVGAGPQPSDVLEYKQANPTATDEQALDAVSKGYRGPTTTASRDKMAARADWLLRKSDTNGFFQGVGGFGENLAELVGLTAAGDPEGAAAHSGPELVSDAAKTWKLLEGNGLVNRLARVGLAAVKGAGEQGAQTYVHTGGDTGQAQTAAELGGVLAPIGQALGEGYGAYRQFKGNLAQAVQPIEKEIEGVPYLQLASELRDEHGAPLAPAAAQKIQLKDEPELLRDRLAAYKQVNTNLAQKAVAQAVADTNDALNASTVGGNIRGTSPSDVVGQADTWRYIPPDGSTSMTAPEARAAMDDIRQQWLGKNWTPQEETQFQQAYDDIRTQLDRRDSYAVSQPYQMYDTAGIANGVDTWRDAATNLDALAKQKMQQLSLSSQFQKLTAARDAAQTAFDNALESGTLDEHIAAQQAVRKTGDDMVNFMRANGAQPQIAPAVAGRALDEQRIANAFRETQNALDKHYTLTSEQAQAIDEPQLFKGRQSFARDIADIKAKYGDVLNPLIGDQGLDHILKLGHSLETPGPERPAADSLTGLVDAISHEYRRLRFGGNMAALSGGAGWYGLHLLGHATLGTAGVVGAVAARARYLQLLRMAATNPKTAQAFIDGMKSTAPVKVLGPQLARIFATIGSNTARNLNGQ